MTLKERQRKIKGNCQMLLTAETKQTKQSSAGKRVFNFSRV